MHRHANNRTAEQSILRFSVALLATLQDIGCVCRYARFVNSVEYQQAFTAAGDRLCICCLAAVTACTAKKTAVLDGAMDLFCGWVHLPCILPCHLACPIHCQEGMHCSIHQHEGMCIFACLALQLACCMQCQRMYHDLDCR